ncbi:pyridoxine/pyridoxamine 5'-phosphate oxidase-like [Leguminivora glycinivorella]|uniref:pyridoxine/pyridoxamine 5'-phosphate oxidase-like n=1 Tax=Leguminivora glycinivorella TaxID=1035111 RepID=UPI00200E1354|nr:pyridoxine/pyridoxamine 5'-phosphate oxidase-like [Leguminivora glycinivorella]
MGRFLARTFVLFLSETRSVRKMSIDIGGMRIKYKDKDETFLEKHLVSKEPFGQFKAWFEEACTKKEILEPNAMCLATVSPQGFPSARFVLLKGYGKEGFKFFTNYGSRKAREMDLNPNVAATFYWEVLNRSIRIEGQVDKLSEEESVTYFHSRPVPSQIAACASHQSTPIESRDVLQERESVLEAQYLVPEKEVPKPSYWGGYIIRPQAVEFWQGQRDRLHDRIKFRKLNVGEQPDGKLLHEGEDGWVYERLSP